MHNQSIASPSQPLFSHITGLLKRACQRGYSVVPCLAHDPIRTRAERTMKGRMEAELYEDGSGFEVAFLGHLFILGVEKDHGRCGAVHPLN